ncbi:MAG TPA: serine protease, partial [Rhodospirillaceae bacterium]|nr:serine protease [Rhodospirillaceae bacterium]
VGNPFGVGQTVTSGIVSAIARTSLDITDINYFIQTDAAINPGNSGGALVGMEGKLVGINSAIYSRSGGSMGLGFAVPSNMVRAIVQSALLGQKKLVRPWTGIKGQIVSNDLAASLGMKRPTGFLINGLHEVSPAREAGMKVGDVITHIQGREIEDPAAFSYRLATLPIGGKAVVRFLRGGKEKSQKIKLIAPPEIPARNVFLIKGENFLQGATVANLSPALAEEYNLSDNKGVVILDVKRSLMAARLGLRKGDIIVKINGDEIHFVKDMKRVVKKGFSYGSLVFKRGDKVRRVMIEKR